MHMLCIFYVQKIDNNMCFLASWMACAFCKKVNLKKKNMLEEDKINMLPIPRASCT